MTIATHTHRIILLAKLLLRQIFLLTCFVNASAIIVEPIGQNIESGFFSAMCELMCWPLRWLPPRLHPRCRLA